MIPTLLLTASSLATGGGPAPAPVARRHDLAFVNDARSHGRVGDNWLSLNEVIQLHNRTLLVAQLSAPEQGQLGGSGTDISWGEIDSANVPVITVERDLDVILDLPHGLLLRGGGLPPILDFTASTGSHGFRSLSNACSFENLLLRGGACGIDLTQSIPVGGQNGTFVRGVGFEGQAVCGMRVLAGVANATVRVLMQDCWFRNAPAGLLLDERAAACDTTFVAVATRMAGVATGMEFLLGSGGTGSYRIDTADLVATGAGVRWVRPNGADRPIEVASTQCTIAGDVAFELAGAAAGPASLGLRMASLRATGATGRALRIAPVGGNVAGAIDELVAEGNVDVLTGGGPALTITNARLRQGTVQLGSSGAQVLSLVDCRFDGCSIGAQGNAPVLLGNCCVVGGAVAGAPLAPLQCRDSFLSGAVGAFVQQTGARSAPHLGSLAVLPAVIAIGGPLIWQADLPVGLVGLFVLGFGVDPLVLALPPYPLHVYSDPAATAILPGIWRLQQSFQSTVPANPVLVGSDFVAQMAVLPDAGVPAPWINFPPGRRFVLR